MQFEVDQTMRLDKFLHSCMSDYSRSQIQEWIKEGIVVNTVCIQKPAHQLSIGDIVECTIPTPQALETSVKPKVQVPLLYEDEECFVVQKPSGLVCHDGVGVQPNDPTLLDSLQPLFTERGLAYEPNHILVHRLDKETSGCILIAKNAATHRYLQSQFKDRAVTKLYLALIEGVPDEPKALIDAPIGRSVSNRTAMKVTTQTKHRPSKTRYEVVSTDVHNSYSLVRCELLTGRTHQIRVHLASIGHPLLYDAKYGSKQTGTFLLHAHTLEWQGQTSKRHQVQSPLPDAFLQKLQELELILPQEYR